MVDLSTPAWLLLVAMFAAGCVAPPPETMTAEEQRHETIMVKARALAPDLDTTEEAFAAGYRPDTLCVPKMGVHWIHKPGESDSYFDPTLDVDHPEVILFEPDTENLSDIAGDQFLGIEYVVVTEGLPTNTTATVPRLYDEPLDGPMPGHFPGMPWHTELHVYLVEGSPSAVGFPGDNEAVACPPTAT